MILLNEHELGILAAFPGSEFGKVFFRLLQHEINDEEETFDLNAKVSNDPINEDWRFKRGLIMGLKRALNLPNKYNNNQQ